MFNNSGPLIVSATLLDWCCYCYCHYCCCGHYLYAYSARLFFFWQIWYGDSRLSVFWWRISHGGISSFTGSWIPGVDRRTYTGHVARALAFALAICYPSLLLLFLHDSYNTGNPRRYHGIFSDARSAARKGARYSASFFYVYFFFELIHVICPSCYTTAHLHSIGDNQFQSPMLVWSEIKTEIHDQQRSNGGRKLKSRNQRVSSKINFTMIDLGQARFVSFSIRL